MWDLKIHSFTRYALNAYSVPELCRARRYCEKDSDPPVKISSVVEETDRQLQYRIDAVVGEIWDTSGNTSDDYLIQLWGIKKFSLR